MALFSLARSHKAARVLPGFNITLGFTLTYLSLIVLIPLSALVFKTFTLTWPQFWEAVTGPRVMASYRLTFGASLIAALVNVVFGLLVAWVLVRYNFFGKKVVDALVDLPFALPTAVAGISLTALLAGNGWVGQYLEPMGIQLAFNPNGVVIALIFIGLPFVVRTVQPVLEDAEKELEEAATCLGATRWQTMTGVVLPTASPGIFSAVMMGFGRAVGETMIVLMATGNAQAFPQGFFHSVRTITATIAIETGEVPYQTTHYFALFAIAFVLFLITLMVNVIGEYYVNKFRKYHSA